MKLAEIRERIAENNRKKAQADLQASRLAYRVRLLPEQLERARARVAMLEREAAELGMKDLL